MRYTLDADSISAIIHGQEIITNMLKYSAEADDTICINAISYYEVKRGLIGKETKNQLKNFIELCRDLPVELMDNISIFDKAAEIYAGLDGSKDIGDCDILIASIACTKNYTVVTNNIRHFKLIQEIIKDLSIENWLTYTQ